MKTTTPNIPNTRRAGASAAGNGPAAQNPAATAVVSTKVTTGEGVRFSYCSVFEPRSVQNGPLRYSCAFLIPKTDTKTLAKVNAAIDAAYRKGINEGKFPRSTPRSAIRNPLRDGDVDRPEDPAYVGCFFLNANASPEHPPLVVDADRNAIMDRGEVYSGCYGRGCVSFFPYNTQGNKGIGCGLIGVQKLQDGEPLGSVVTAESAFGYADDDEDFLQ